jgi:hypothetical protein
MGHGQSYITQSTLLLQSDQLVPFESCSLGTSPHPPILLGSDYSLDLSSSFFIATTSASQNFFFILISFPGRHQRRKKCLATRSERQSTLILYSTVAGTYSTVGLPNRMASSRMLACNTG